MQIRTPPLPGLSPAWARFPVAGATGYMPSPRRG